MMSRAPMPRWVKDRLRIVHRFRNFPPRVIMGSLPEPSSWELAIGHLMAIPEPTITVIPRRTRRKVAPVGYDNAR